LMKGIQIFLKSPFFVSMATAAKFVQPIPIYLAYLVPLDVDVVPIINFCSASNLLWSFLCFFQFFSILTVSMATAAILKKSPLKGTTSHGIWYFYKVS
jgi:hypothetical protein